MKAGKYTVRELFVNSYIEQIVIPEIQRDYVWGEEQVKGILDSIKEDFETFCVAKVDVQSDNTELIKLFEEFYKKQMFSSNIGFIYAYNDPEYTGKYFLIDGQQRITTIYLLLLALCIKTDKTVFQKYYHTNNILKLDYRVRDTAHLFLKNFVNYFLSDDNPSVEKVENQHWFFNANELDPTINSIIANYKTILSFLDANNLYQASFLDYIQNYIEFWYFDTSLSDQGEELYIYMNARGEQIQPNENLKADLISTLRTQEEKNIWGIKWEEWQDFFWHNRGDNENADIGFNEFINCIAGLEFYKNKLENPVFDNQKLTELLSLSKIESYINTLIYLKAEKGSFIMQYAYSAWVDAYYNLIWSFLNKSIKRNTNWFANYKDKNRGDDRNSMILLWSLFYFYNFRNEDIVKEEFFRVMRFFYIRYHNYNRSVSTLKNTIHLIETNGVIDKIDNILETQDENPEDETDTKFRTAEESSKYQFLSQYILQPETLRKYESLIWEIEDHKLNLDGKYLGNINSSHLIAYVANPSLEALQKIKDRFFLLMNFEEGSEEDIFLTLLLHYGEFWIKISPWYYSNYKFDEWRRIIRGADGDKVAFKNFFSDFLLLENPLSLNELLTQKQKLFANELVIENISAIQDLKNQLIVYSLLGLDIWENGCYIAVAEKANDQRIFENEKRIYNTQGDFRGYSNKELWEEVKSKNISELLISKKQELN